MALLGAIKVGHPDAGPMASHLVGNDAGGAAVPHDVDHHLIVLESQFQWVRPSIRTPVSVEPMASPKRLPHDSEQEIGRLYRTRY